MPSRKKNFLDLAVSDFSTVNKVYYSLLLRFDFAMKNPIAAEIIAVKTIISVEVVLSSKEINAVFSA